MSETANGKIQTLLENAARQNDSPNAASNSVESAARHFPNEAEAEKAFSYFHTRLFNIKKWNDESSISSFELFDETGNSQPEKTAADGDFIKITLPGSGKDDWVKIVEIYETPDEIVLTVQPSHNPAEKENEKTTSHFFTGDSTNNFCLQRIGSKVIFYVIGLEEKTNTTETGGVIETVRNFATANIGSFLGIQNIQWRTFCENFIEKK